jgi:hypothetical protein
VHLDPFHAKKKNCQEHEQFSRLEGSGGVLKGNAPACAM